MNKHGAKLVCVAVLAASVFVSEPAAAAVGRTSTGQRPLLAAAVLVRLNVIRGQHGRLPLTRNANLTLAASRHSSEMVSDGYFAHESSDGSPFWRRVRRFHGRWTVGENLLCSMPDVGAGRALELWMASPEHRADDARPGVARGRYLCGSCRRRARHVSRSGRNGHHGRLRRAPVAPLRNGTIELDLRVTGERSFPGVTWRGGADGFESFFVRPHQVGNPDAIQYSPCFHGVSAWQLYTGDGFWAPIDFPLGEWFTIRVVCEEERAEMYVADLETPALVARLRLAPRAGELGTLGGDGVELGRFEHDTAVTFRAPERAG